MNSVCFLNASIKNTNKVLVPLGEYYVKTSVYQAKQIG